MDRLAESPVAEGSETVGRPTVSVIVPVYNAERYLARCIDSVVRQTYDVWELVCVDDGSSDGSLEVCLRYQRAYPDKIVVAHQENQGSRQPGTGGFGSPRESTWRFWTTMTIWTQTI